jgi:hypothetical protein
MAEREFKVKILGDGSGGQKMFRDLAGESDRFSGTITKLGGLLGTVFAVNKLGDFFKSSVSEAREAAAVTRDTEAVLKSMGGQARVTADDVADLATEISNYSGIDDEAIQSAENLLLTFGNIQDRIGKNNDIFTQASKVVADFSVRFGVDLNAAAVQVGKALNDPAEGLTKLTRVGVTFTDQQKQQVEQMMKVGDIAGAQKVILAELGRETAGAAVAATDPWQRLTVVWGNVKETVGTALLPAILSIGTGLSDALPKIVEFGERVGGALGERIDFADVRAKAENFLEGATPKVEAFLDKTRDAISNGSQTIIDGFQTGIVTGNWEPLGESVGAALSEGIKGAASAARRIGSAIADTFDKVDWVGIGIGMGRQAPSLLTGLALGLLDFDLGGLLTGLAENWQTVLIGVLSIALTPAKWIEETAGLLGRIPLAGSLIEWSLLHLKTWSDELLHGAMRAIGAIWTGFLRGLEHFGPSLSALDERLLFFISRVGARALDMLDTAKTFIGKIPEGILSGLEAIGNVAGAVVRKLLDTLGDIGAAILRSRTTMMTDGMIQALADGLAAFVRFYFELPNRIVTAIGDLGAAIARSRAGEVMRSMASGASGAVGSVVDFFRGMGGRVLDAVGDLSRLLWNVGQKIIEGLINGIRSKFNDVKGALGDLTNKMTDWKGPEETDARLLTPAGKTIMDSLVQGLREGMPAVRDELQSLTGEIGNGSFTPTAPVVQGRSGPSHVSIEVNINGTLDRAITADDIRDAVAEAISELESMYV